MQISDKDKEWVESIIITRPFFSFDFQLPIPTESVRRVLYLHTFPEEKSLMCIKRLRQLYPQAQLHVVASAARPFSNGSLDGANLVQFPGERLPDEFHNSPEGKQLKAEKFDLAFYGYDFSLEANPIEIYTKYGNVLENLVNLGYVENAYVIDRRFLVRKFACYAPWTVPVTIQDTEIHIPFTLMSKDEVCTLFDLAGADLGDGAIVNIGQFMGGSTIILAKASKRAGKSKIHSFDPLIFDPVPDYFKKNEVDDWIEFSLEISDRAIHEWSKREDPKIRLLFVDGDHAYQGCKNDIANWSPYLISGGVIAVHDYGTAGAFPDVDRAVYDTIINSGDYEDFKKVDTLFYARKK